MRYWAAGSISHAAVGRLIACASLVIAGCCIAAEPAKAPAARLRAILDQVAAHGDYFPPEPPVPGRVMLEDPVKPDENKDHVQHIVGIYGAVMNNRLLVQLASIELRDWKRQPDGNWKMDQWLFRLTLGGEIERAIHRWRIENPEHTNIMRIEEENVSLDGARGKKAAAIYEKLLGHWDNWSPR